MGHPSRHLFRSVTTLGGKSMWFGSCGYVYVCVCVSLCSRMENHVCAQSIERLGSFNFDVFSLLRAREVSLCNHSLCSVSICSARHLGKTQLCWWYNKEIQSASEHAKEGDILYVWNMLMKADLNDCLRMHVRTNAGLWISEHLNVVFWCNAAFSHLWWIYLLILQQTLAVYQIMAVF